MKRQGGWCLIEMLVVTFTASSVALAAASLIEKQERTNVVLGSYEQGLRELRTVLFEMGEDVRAGGDLEATGWKLVGNRLYRGTRLRATHIARVEVTEKGPLTTIRLSPMSRIPGADPEPTTTLTLRVAPRAGAER